MKATPNTEKVIYLFVILLSLAILGLMAISPDTFMQISAVYQGF
jgi:hypothetical protein